MAKFFKVKLLPSNRSLSSIDSANSFFSLRFSSSSCFSRLASLTYAQRLFVTDMMTQCVDCLAKTVLFDRVERKSAPLPDDVRRAAERMRVAEYRQDRT